ncbi:hypothetical protein B0H13DRAFT_2067808 [Mycena leptocephala]|nr:hypothetical protein B0H13DRAFT_2067808 [Mycena leptocephala]
MASTGRFPLELERLMFEYAAENISAIPTLLLVAHRVRVWLEPLLYTVLRLDSSALLAAVLESLDAKPASFLASNVRHVLVYASSYVLRFEAVEKLLELCSGIRSLSLIGDITGSNLLPALGNMNIQRLSVDSESRDEDSPVDLEHPLFAAVTHLDIFDDIDIEEEEPEGMQWLQSLSILPALTHLAFSTAPNPRVLHDVLENCPHIRVLLVVFPITDTNGAKAYVEELSVVDARLGARGGKDIWIRAEEFMTRKRRGEVEVGDYFLDGSTAVEAD